MTCTYRIWGDDSGLTCLRTDEHATGHIFAASDAPDRHSETEAS